MTSTVLEREAAAPLPNPLGLEGIEFVEYSTPRPQALGHVFEGMGFRLIARHRSREVLLYRQGDMNVVINGHERAADEAAQIAAIGLRVRDAGAAWQQVVDAGGWPVPVQVQPMELHIPGVHGVGSSRLYFIDRWREFSIFDVDFVRVPTVDSSVPALAGLHWYGIVQYIGLGRRDDWLAFYRELLGFQPLPEEQRAGILPSGTVLVSPCGTFGWQLIEPDADAATSESERLQRVAFGAPNVPAAVAALRARGVDFVETDVLHTQAKGALTRPVQGTMFELVHHS